MTEAKNRTKPDDPVKTDGKVRAGNTVRTDGTMGTSGRVEACGQKTILLGVTGCIAAYKSAELLRTLQKKGFRVKVVMTEHATEFVGPATFRALSGEEVAVGLFDEPGAPIHHISLADEADLFLVAPCTANVMAKLAWGVADDLLTTTALATTAPLVIAPAMNVKMYENEVTRANRRILEGRGVSIVDAEEGYLACGEEGKGRLAELSRIVREVECILAGAQEWEGRRVLVTAGPTVEAIDPVRFMSNHSTGKMGYALAEAAVRCGGEVTLVSGPTSLTPPAGLANFVAVTSAIEMFEVAQSVFDACDCAIFSAAVSDMRPAQKHGHKLKKAYDGDSLRSMELVENPDILKTLGQRKENRVVIGFAAETDQVIANAKNKLIEKAADCIVANEVGNDKGFGKDENKAWLVTPDEVIDLPLMSKKELAFRILDHAKALLLQKDLFR